MTTRIDYQKVSWALNFYESNGYRYIEAPWIVTQDALRITLPKNRVGYQLGHPNYSPGYLVGSAEQSFLQLLKDRELPPGRYVAAGPCFRDELIIDELHQTSFFKVELIELAARDTFTKLDVERVAMGCRNAMQWMSGQNAYIIETPEGLDIEINGIEVGSYGIRSHEDASWVYATGLALPRFDQACKR